MKLRRFFIKIASRAEKLTKRVSPELISAIKKLGVKDIQKIFRQFVPLDFITLIQKHNTRAFEEAFRNTIAQSASTDQHKKWIEEAGILKEDAINDTYINMLNDDPKKRGILNEILLDGSMSDKFQYAREEEPELRLALKQTIGPISSANGIMIPFCPIDKSINQDYPLWNINIENGEVSIYHGLDKDGQCTNRENLGKMSPEQFEQIARDYEGLTAEQIELIKQGKRELEYLNGVGFLRCVFKGNMPKFSSFLYPRVTQSIKDIVNTRRKELGKTIPPEKLRRRIELLEKEKKGTLTPEEEGELNQLKSYFNKKSKELVPSLTSLDTPMEGAEGAGKTRHEMVSKESDEDDKNINEAKFELARILGENELNSLMAISSKIELSGIINKFKTLMTLPSKDPQRIQIQQDIKNNLYMISQKYLGQDNKTENVCNTCHAVLGETSSVCPYASQMRGYIYNIYEVSTDFIEFKKQLEKLDEYAKIHFNESNIQSKIEENFKGAEVTEEDVSNKELEDLLSTFKSYEDINIEKAEKTSVSDLKNNIEKHLSEHQKVAYFGTNVNSNLEVTEKDIDKIQGLANFIEQSINKVFEQELEEELISLLIRYGVGE